MRLSTYQLRSLLTDPTKNRKMWMTDVYHFDLITGQHLSLSGTDIAIQLRYRDVTMGSGPVLFWALSETSGTIVHDELNYELPTGAHGDYVGSSSSVDGLVNNDLGEHARLFSGGSARINTALQELPGHASEASALGRAIFNLPKGFTLDWWWKSSVTPGTDSQTMVYIATGSSGGAKAVQAHARWSTNSAFQSNVFNYPGPVFGYNYLDEQGSQREFWIPIPVPGSSGSNARNDAGSLIDVTHAQANTLYHFVVSFDGTFLKTFVNGVQTNCVEAPRSYTIYSATDGGTVSVGGICWPGSSSTTDAATNGRMQNFAIYPHPSYENAAYHRYNAGVSAHIFEVNTLRVNRSSIKMKVGIDVDTLELDVFPSIDDQLLVSTDPENTYVPMIEALHNGAFDGAAVSVHRCFSEDAPSWGDPALGDGTITTSAAYPQGVFVPDGALTIFSGHITELEITEIQVRFTVKSALDYLNLQLPRYVYKPGCTWDLYSYPCGVKQSAYLWGGNAKTAGPEVLERNLQTNVYSTVDPGKDPGYYDQGHIVFLSGKNSFIRRPIKSHIGNHFALFQALPYVPEPGDRFEVAPGCDKTLDTCTAKFNNAKRFRGFPLVPLADSAQGLPVERADASVAPEWELPDT